jgi:transposase-like protein
VAPAEHDRTVVPDKTVWEPQRQSVRVDPGVREALAQVARGADLMVTVVREQSAVLAELPHRARILGLAELEKGWRRWVSAMTRMVTAEVAEAFTAAQNDEWSLRMIAPVAGMSFSTVANRILRHRDGSAPPTASSSTPSPSDVDRWVRELVDVTRESVSAQGMAAEFRSGVSVSTLVQRHGMSEQQIWDILQAQGVERPTP